MDKRVFLIVLDSVGIGEMPDAAAYGDEGSNTMRAAVAHGAVLPNMEKLGLFSIDGMDWYTASAKESPIGAYARMQEASRGKDTTIGHWEISGIISPKPLPTYPNGFPQELLERFSELTGRGVLCNKPYSGTQLLTDYGKQHMETGDLLVYTSADSVFQVAAHEDIVPVEELYRCCQIARDLLQGEHGVGRVIARPFLGEAPNFTRTANRRDFSLEPPKTTMLDLIADNGYACIGVGKIYDIFAGRGITEKIKTKNNTDGIARTMELLDRDFQGLCFVNLVDFDMLYGHRNDPVGYANALNEFDAALGQMLSKLREGDLLMITADHGCDPVTPSTDHSREYTPMLAYSPTIKAGNLGTHPTFGDIAATILEYLGIEGQVDGTSYLNAMQ